MYHGGVYLMYEWPPRFWLVPFYHCLRVNLSLMAQSLLPNLLNLFTSSMPPHKNTGNLIKVKKQTALNEFEVYMPKNNTNLNEWNGKFMHSLIWCIIYSLYSYFQYFIQYLFLGLITHSFLCSLKHYLETTESISENEVWDILVDLTLVSIIRSYYNN